MIADCPTRYHCPECNWEGGEEEMEADFYHDGEGDEMWSNWICPKCKTWWWLDDYEVVE